MRQRQQLGSRPDRMNTINWSMLQQDRHDLQELDRDITEEEIRCVVMQTAPEKSPSPDGYIGAFFNVCWDVIKNDLTNAITEIFALRAGCWSLLNSANTVLLPKKDGAQCIADYHPISIMHSVAKLLAKIMANRLAPKMDNLISRSHSAFMKGRSIQDNFQYGRERQTISIEAKLLCSCSNLTSQRTLIMSGGNIYWNS
jgi:hypothetical protein